VAPSGEPPKRRLPILQGHTTAQQPDDEERPPWHWSAIGAVAIFVAWLPLAAAAQAVSMRALERAPDPAGAAESVPISIRLAMIALHLVAFALAAFAGGLLVGRFGAKAGPKEAAIAGFLASSLAWALAAAQPQQGPGPGALIWGMILVVLGSLGAAIAYSGGRTGVRRRPPGG
jgi:tRNA-(ms[2]io[6]A)-hydroxylase